MYFREARLLIAQTRDELAATREQVAQAGEQVSTALSALSDQIQADRAALASGNANHEQVLEVLRFVHDRPAARRQRLHALRAEERYEQSFTASDPLVSVVIPTYDNYELLRERAIPSVLAQTYQNLELIIVGDAASEQARLAVASFGDTRISFVNLPYRGPYPQDPLRRWLVAGVPPYNEGVRRAQGLWIAPLDDDDAFHPDHVERLLDYARRHRLELAYGQLRVHLPNGDTFTLGRFPPENGQFGIQSALYHRGLADIFEPELADAALGLPYDWGLCLRMLEAGVLIGMMVGETADYYPSRAWTPRFDPDIPSSAPPEPPPEWEYVPEGWKRARRTDDASARGWGVNEVALAYRDKWHRFLDAVEGPGPLGASHETPTDVPIGRTDLVQQTAVLAFAYSLSRAANGSKALSVLDWGGALGHYYVFARRLFPGLQLEYHCRELPSVCAVGRSVLPEVTFHDDDRCFERRYDLVMASNALQYEEDWERLMRRLVQASAGWTFLTRVPIVRAHESFVVLQRAYSYGYGTEYLGWVLSRNLLVEAARSSGLELDREFVLLEDWPIARAPSEVALAGFLFRAHGRD